MDFSLVTNNIFDKKTKDRFFKYIPDAKVECWIWDGPITAGGYGQFHYNGMPRYAHRIAYEMFHGPIPEGMLVCHTCDEKRCVSPYHLYVGTYSDNLIDRYTRHPETKRIIKRSDFTKDQADLMGELRNEGLTYENISSLFGVTRQTISNIVNERTTLFKEI